jgi:hypothetical protein
MSPNPKAAMMHQADQLPPLLGEKPMQRLQRLIATEDDWDGQGAKALSAIALDTFCGFIRQVCPDPDDLGLFLGFDGALIVSCHDHHGAQVDLVFGDGLVEYCSARHEGTHAADDPELLTLLRQAPCEIANN